MEIEMLKRMKMMKKKNHLIACCCCCCCLVGDDCDDGDGDDGVYDGDVCACDDDEVLAVTVYLICP
jgi:hypothetical protein